MRWEQQVQFASQTDLGLRRKNNEDAYAARLSSDELEWRARGHLFLVADGMGGHAVGELASKIAAETVPHNYFKLPEAEPATLLRQAITSANEAIHRRGSENRDFQRMGTTCTSLVLSMRGLFIGHVGDSRVYRIRRDRIDQLTFDHSLVWELQRKHPKAAAQLNLSEHKNVITRSLGPEAQVEVDVEGPYPIFPGDIYVLCSDGLSGQVTDEEIGGVARELSPAQACRLLVHLANLRGGADNCTVQVVRVGELPANVPFQVEEPPRPETGLGWSWLASFWGVGMFLLLGLMLFLFGRLLEGAVLTSLSAGALTILTWAAWKRHRADAPPPPGDDNSVTNYWRPYRTAIAKPSDALLEELIQLETDVRRAAEEEQWGVDWESHRQSIDAAQKGLQQQRYAKAIRDISRAIDILMTELPRPAESGEIAAARMQQNAG